VSNVGDLGRRVTERREELGLTVDEVAARAGMDASYVRMLETNPSPQPSRAALWRLAGALETTVDAVSGGGFQAPPGRTDASLRPTLEALGREDCQALIGPGGVGRVVFFESRGPVALPVNFRMLEGNVVFRTEPESALTLSLTQGQVSFEVDHLDDALTEGWSVLISGEGQEVVDPAERERAQALGVAPWAGGRRDTYVRIVPHEVTGRRIRRS
jgi:transcriptional regulator with XRE-family HTH domain